MAEGLAARLAALELLMGVLGDRRPLPDMVDGPILAKLDASDRARAQRLALETLRKIEPIDHLLQGFVRKEPPLAILNILRLAVCELHGGAASHGVVNSAVEIARRDKRQAALSGLVNAVLRKVPAGATLTGQAQHMPRWLRQPAVHAYGREAVGLIEAVQAKSPPLDLTLRESPHPEGRLLPNGSLRIDTPGQISMLAGYAEGAWWVQDAAASTAVRMLGEVKGHSVLDLCAAPGGKTLQLAAAGAKVTALDISGPRLQRLAENLARTGLSAKIVTADALHWTSDGLFDAVLLDAPCSASGTIRRHPDLQFIKDGAEIPALIELQRQLFDRALSFVKPGGRLVFCTCSLLPEEGEHQLDQALQRHQGLRVVRPVLAGIQDDWFTPAGGLRLRPDYWADWGGMDGFFMACVTK